MAECVNEEERALTNEATPGNGDANASGGSESIVAARIRTKNKVDYVRLWSHSSSTNRRHARRKI